MSSLRLVRRFVAVDDVNKISIEDVFTDDFEIYNIQIRNTRAGTQRENNSQDMRLISAGGSEISSTIYDNESHFARGITASVLEVGGASRDDFALLYHDTSGQKGNGNMNMWIFNPFQSDRYTFHIMQVSARMSYPTTTSIPHVTKSCGVLKQKSCITGFSLTNRNSYDIEAGDFRVYGLAT